MSTDTLHTKDYFTDFHTNEYLEAYTYFDELPCFVKHLKELVRAFAHNSSQLGHHRALEFGGGPTLVTSFLLAQFVRSITFSEYAPSNLKAVEDWMNQKSDAHDWANVFKAIIEEYRQQTGTTIELSEAEEHLRQALRQGGLVQTGDVNECGHCPVLDNPANCEQFDIIVSSFCLEGACLSHETYKATVLRLYALLKPGGFLLFVHARNQTFYYVNGKKFHAIPLNEKLASETWKEIGLVNIQLAAIERTPNMDSDSNGYFTICGNKAK